MPVSREFAALLTWLFVGVVAALLARYGDEEEDGEEEDEEDVGVLLF